VGREGGREGVGVGGGGGGNLPTGWDLTVLNRYVTVRGKGGVGGLPYLVESDYFQLPL